MSSFDDLSKFPTPPRSPRSKTPASETLASPTLPQDPASHNSTSGLDTRDHDRDPEKVRQEAWDEDNHATDHANKENLSDRLQGTHITDTSSPSPRPSVPRHDTDSFDDYPDTASKTPIGETPGEDLKVSPYDLEHPTTTTWSTPIKVSSSPPLFPVPGVGGSEASVASSVNYPKYGVGSSPAVVQPSSDCSRSDTAAALGSESEDRKTEAEELEPATPSSLLWPEGPSGWRGPLPPPVEDESGANNASPPRSPVGTQVVEPLVEHESGREMGEQGSKEKEAHKVGIVEKIKDALSGHHKEEGKKDEGEEK